MFKIFCKLNEFGIVINRIHKISVRPDPNPFFEINIRPDPDLKRDNRPDPFTGSSRLLI